MSWSWDTDPANRHRKARDSRLSEQREKRAPRTVANVLFEKLQLYRPDPDNETTFALIVRIPKDRQAEIVEKMNRVFGPSGNEFVVYSRFTKKRFEIREVESR